MPHTLQRKTDGERLMAAETHIQYLQRGDKELKEKIDELDEKVDAIDVKLDAVITRLDAQANRLIGASTLAKILWLGFPAASATVAWIIRGSIHQ